MTSKPVWAERDPHFEREIARYGRAMPSREFLLTLIGEQKKVVTEESLAQELDLVSEDDRVALSRRLRAMVNAGQLVRNRRDGLLPVNQSDLIRGRVVGHPDGFGFLLPEDGSDDLFLHAKQMRMVLHGDRAVCSIRGVDKRGRKEGQVVEVLERANTEVVGRFMTYQGQGFVIPDNKRITQDVIIFDGGDNGAQPGQIVVAVIESQPDKHAPPLGRVMEVLGEHMAPGMEIDVAIRAHGLPHRWNEELLIELDGFEEEVPEAAFEGREDLRHLPFVTIDGADARDFDDAVCCKRTPKGWKLWVAIADVSHYVKPGSALDSEAFERGNSVYFPDMVLPMLPEKLSNGLCSLNPKVNRLAMVCEMTLDADGVVLRSRFMRAVFVSKARLIYDDVAALLDGDEALRERYSERVEDLERLRDLYRVLRKRREARGAIDFETVETRIVYGADKKIERVEPVTRNIAHMMIEECMLAANETTARWLLKRKMPVVYRVHASPKPEKLSDLREFLEEFGLSLPGGDEPSPSHYQQLLDQVQKRPDAHLIQTVVLRSMNQAVYTPDNDGHFGLAYEAYTHFTSPIRRYPDLLVHRAIGHVLDGGKAKDFVYDMSAVANIGEHCSATERRADEATRDAVSWLKCEFMLDKVGESFSGTISSVTSFGLFIELDEIFVEGLAHVTTLASDYYQFDPVGHRMVGERSGTVYRLGDRVQVQVARVDLDQRKIDFAVLSGTDGDAKPAAAEHPDKKRRSSSRKSGGKSTGKGRGRSAKGESSKGRDRRS